MNMKPFLALIFAFAAALASATPIIPNPSAPDSIGTPTNQFPGVFATNGNFQKLQVNGVDVVTNPAAGSTNGGATLAAGTGITVTVSGGTNIISLYSAPTITAFANNQNPQEVGATVTSTLLTWTRAGGPVTSLALDNSIGSVATNLTSYSHTSSYTTARTYIMTASDGTTTATASTTVNFYSKIYWGASAQTASTITDGQIIALGGAFATSRATTQTISTASTYLFFCYPAAWGAATFTVNGFPDAGWTLVTRNVTNASGGIISYRIYQHTLATIGDFTVQVQ
jgi:hypothetical protein